MQIKYIDNIQLAFLRWLYNGVSQKFTYFCINGAAYYDRFTQNYDNAVEFQGDNDYEWDLKSVKPSDVPFDGCQVKLQLYSE